MKQRILILVFGSCVGIGVFLYSVFSWYSGILSVVQILPEETIETADKVASSLSRSLEDKFGQMLMIGFDGTEATPEVSSLFSNIRPGGVLLLSRNIVNKEQTKKLIADLQEISMRTTGLPLFVAVDQEGGIVSRIPWVESTAPFDLKDEDEAFLIAEKRAQDLKEVGVNMNLAPVLDGAAEEDFLFNRSFQKSPAVSRDLAHALVAGHQKEGVIAVPKHFPGYDGVSFNPETGVLPTAKNFPQAPLFKEMLELTQVPFVMLSHVVYQSVDPDNPLPLSEKGMEQARKELGDQVLFMSDDLASRSLMAHYSLGEIGKRALNAGVNMLLVGGYPNTAVVGEFYKALQNELVEGSGKLQGHVEESATKIIKLKQEMLE